MRSIRLQHKRKFNVLAFRDVKTTCRKHFLILGMIREEFGGQRSWHNDKTRPCLRHEIHSAPAVQWRKKAVHAAAKIPNQTRLSETDGAKFHIGSQVLARLPEELIRREESCDQRRNDKSNRKIGQNRYRRAILEEAHRVFSGQPLCKQKCEQWQRRQRVMRQFGFDQTENDKNDCDARDEVMVDVVLV